MDKIKPAIQKYTRGYFSTFCYNYQLSVISYQLLRLFYSCLVFLSNIMLMGCRDNSAEIDAAAKLLLEQNMEELRITADETCLEKRATYIKIYKDSLAALKGKKANQGDE